MKIKRLKENNLINNRDWKEKDNNYIIELQRFFDRVDNIENEELRISVINQMLQCDKTLTELAENMFQEFYQKGYKEAKKG